MKSHIDFSFRVIPHFLSYLNPELRILEENENSHNWPNQVNNFHELATIETDLSILAFTMLQMGNCGAR